MKKQLKEEKRKNWFYRRRESKRGKTVEKRNWLHQERGICMDIGKNDLGKNHVPAVRSEKRDAKAERKG